jgi:ribonuclease BN (tRNA processing enzyme)
MELIVLGAGPAYTDRPGALGAAYLLRHGDDSLLLELGQGLFPSLMGELEPSDLNGIVVSHLHPDHFIDLVPMRHYLRYEWHPPRHVTVHGPGDLNRRLDALHDEPAWAECVIDLDPLGEDVRTIGPFRMESRRVTHTDDSYGFRVTVDGGPGLVYSGDCGKASDLLKLIRPGDVLLTEIGWGAGPAPVDGVHLDGHSIAAIAGEARPGRILLTHIQMGYDLDDALASVRNGYRGDVRFVWPGDRQEV